MSWNYRVIHRRHPVPDHLRAAVGSDFEDSYAVHEVYYDKTGKPDKCTVDPCALTSETPEGLAEVKLMMGMALRKPTLEWDDFGSDAPTPTEPA